MKKVNVKIVDIENMEFELLEDAFKGDVFSLYDDLDAKKWHSKIKELVEEKRNEYINSELKNQWKNEFLASKEYKQILEDKNKSDQEIVVLKSQIESLKEKVNDDKKIMKMEMERENSIQFTKKDQTILNLNIRIKELESDIENLVKNRDLEINNQIMMNKEKWDQELHKKQTSIEKISLEKQNNEELLRKNYESSMESQKFSYENKLLQKENEITKLMSERDLIKIKIENEVKDEMRIKDEEIARLKREKPVNSKMLGENLEQWIKSEYDSIFSMMEDSTFVKDNEVIEGSKADFLFEVKHKDAFLGRVVIEAKTQLDGSEGKNEKFFPKLAKDMKKKDASFGLLITELEPEDHFVIKKVSGYENMFMVRPQYFVSFLSLARYIFIQKKPAIEAQIDFKQREKILEEFKNMQNEILNNSLKHINTNLEVLLSQIENIDKSSRKMREIVEGTLKKHIETFKNKIDNFKITKIVKEIANIEDENR